MIMMNLYRISEFQISSKSDNSFSFNSVYGQSNTQSGRQKWLQIPSTFFSWSGIFWFYVTLFDVKKLNEFSLHSYVFLIVTFPSFSNIWENSYNMRVTDIPCNDRGFSGCSTHYTFPAVRRVYHYFSGANYLYLAWLSWQTTRLTRLIIKIQFVFFSLSDRLFVDFTNA